MPIVLYAMYGEPNTLTLIVCDSVWCGIGDAGALYVNRFIYPRYYASNNLVTHSQRTNPAYIRFRTPLNFI